MLVARAMKTILLTGGTHGIGQEAAVVLARTGHRVVIVGRDRARTDEALADIQRRSNSTHVESLLADFSRLADVHQLAADYRAKYDRLDVLINNAGTVFAKRTVTGDGLEATFAVNHLAPFLLTNLLVELLEKSAPARIVNVASGSHYVGTMDFDDLGYEKGGYWIMKAYERSKLANVLFTRTLAKRLEGRGVTVNALHPGTVATNIYRYSPGWTLPFLAVAKVFMLSPERGAQTIIHAATSPELEGQTGLYLEKNRPRKPAPLALDEGVAARLWAESERLTARARA